MMNLKKEILSRFRDGGATAPLYLPDLGLWHEWHVAQDTLPPEWQGYTLAEIARALGVPVWLPVAPWRLELQGVDVAIAETEEEKVTRVETSRGTLTARLVLGPDGDWWDAEYPVKTAADLPAALDWARAHRYHLDSSHLAEAQTAVGDDGVVALTLPRRPFSRVFFEVLGFSDGLTLLNEPLVGELVGTLEVRLQALVREIARLNGDLIWAPDNLDGQFISPRMFERHLSGSYRETAETVHTAGKHLVVHVGGPVRHLLGHFVEAGVDGLEGISGPPQNNATLAQARQIAGPNVTLWGGIPQDYLLDTHPWDAFETAVRQAGAEATGDPRTLVGVADRVPTLADPDRIAAIPELLSAV
jgi:hypothetical protein